MPAERNTSESALSGTGLTGNDVGVFTAEPSTPMYGSGGAFLAISNTGDRASAIVTRQARERW